MSFTGEPENNINMEDEKMKVSFEEIGYMSATFAAERGEAGQVCKMAGNGRVAPCADGDAFIGVLEGIRRGCAGVQIHGFVKVSYTGSAPSAGYIKLVANGNGGVKVGGTKDYLVVGVDSNNMTLTIEL